MSKEAMKLALEALKQIDEAMPFPVAKLAQAALREALAEQSAQQCRTDGRCQYAIDSGAEGMGHCPKGKCVMPAKQEPAAVVSGYYNGQCVILPIDPAQIFNSNTPLYTFPTQRTWVGLTDEEIAVLDIRYHRDNWRLIKEAEAKLKEKNA